MSMHCMASTALRSSRTRRSSRTQHSQLTPTPPLTTYHHTHATHHTYQHSRVFTDAVLLPNGQVLVCNGAQRGVPGGTIDGGGTAKDAALTALLYDPEKPAGSRITPLASSTIHRYYHSTAMLLPSGDVWVGGSEQGALSFFWCRRRRRRRRRRAFSPRLLFAAVQRGRPLLVQRRSSRFAAGRQSKRTHNNNFTNTPSPHTHPAPNPTTADCVDTCKEGGLAPPDQEYRAELLQLPYAFQDRPEITAISASKVGWGGKVTVSYKHSKAVTSATIIPPTATTHSTNMMQRVVFLKIVASSPGSVTVELPKLEDRVVNPGWFMLWVNADDVPCKEAQWIQLG